MNNKHLTPVWIVYVDGQRLDIAHEGALQRIVVDDKLNDVGVATLEFDTSYLQVRDAGTFWLESEVSVHLGYKDDCQQVFVGEVTEFIQEYREYGHQRLKVVCKNCLHRLQNAHQALSVESKTLSEALVSRLESYGIKAQVDSFGTKKYFVESQITDYEFLMESANKYGKTVYAHGNKVYVQDEVTISNEDVVLEWGKSLVYFRGRESLKGQLSGCSFVGWDSRKGQGITGRVSLGEVPVKVGGGRSWEDNSKAAGGRWHSTIMEESLRDREEAVVLAKAYLQNLSMQYQMAECKCEGDQRIFPGMRVTVKYVGESYSGEYIANHVLHEFSVYGGYTTTLYLKRNMAGGEKKQVSPIDSEMMRERLRRMEERMHGPVDREQVAVHEAEVEPALAAETAPPAESQETGEEYVYGFGKIAGDYRNWTQQNSQWKDLPLAPGTMEKYGCKITAAAKIVCTITGNGSFDPARFLGMDSNIQGTEGPSLAFEKYVDDNGNLSQQGIMNAMGRANPSVEVKHDYFEKTLGHAILKELKEDEDYIHYILGRAQIGGGLGQHWVVIEDYSVTEQGVIRYECVGSSDNDAGREFTSDPNAASGTNKKLACVDKIEVYSVRRK